MSKAQCNKCSKEYELQAQFEGKKAKCTQCGNTFTITFEKNNQEASISKEKKIETNPKMKANKFINFLKHTIKSPSILVNFLFILHIIIFITLHTVGDILLSIFAGIIIPLFNIYILIKFKNNIEKKSVFLIILNILLNVGLFFLLIFFLIDIGIPKQLDNLITALFLFLVPGLSLYYILKGNIISTQIIKDNLITTKILKYIKWFFITLLSGLIVLLISVYISKLNLYKAEDFNIPENALETKFGDKDPFSTDNGYIDFVDFMKFLETKDISYIDFLSQCLFDNEENNNTACTQNVDYYESTLKSNTIVQYVKNTGNITDTDSEIENNIGRISYFIENIKKSQKIDIINAQQFFSKYKKNNISEKYVDIYFLGLEYYKTNKEKILEKKYNEFKNFAYVNRLKYEKIKNKKFLLPTPEYTGAYDATKPYHSSKNTYLRGETLVYTSLLQYSRGLRYVAYNYFENGEYDLGIDTLLEYQEFIDYLINKTDSNLIQTLVYFKISSINLEAIEYFLDNYNLTDEQKNKIQHVLEYKIDKGLVENSFKFDHYVAKSVFAYLYDSAFHDEKGLLEKLRSIIEVTLFFSVEESILISEKITYDVITNNGAESDFKCKKNISNYAGRSIMCNYSIEYIKTYEKEKNLRMLRENILEKLKIPE